MKRVNEKQLDRQTTLTEKRVKEIRQREREREFIRQVDIDCLAVVSKGTAMLWVEVAVTPEFSGITFGYGLKLAGI